MENNARKNITYSVILLLLLLGVYLYRQNQAPSPEGEAENENITFTGKTMGTTNRIVDLEKERRNLQAEIDSILRAFNQSLSTYIPESELSKFNKADSLAFELPYLLPVLKKSREVYFSTGGAFDPTIGPLVNAWGFGPEGATEREQI